MSQIVNCHKCGARVKPNASDACPLCSAPLSVPDDMIEAASVPNLASLFKQAKKAGHIKPGFQYGNPT